MTSGNPRPDQEPTPPLTTGWAPEPAEMDEELAPPFIPGGAPRPVEPAPGGDAGEDDGTEAFPFPPDEPAAGAGRRELEDDFPVHAFQIEGAEVEPAAGEIGYPHEAPDDSVHDLADRLEAMARRLRAEGSAAAEAEMSAPDRFTALLAGLLAGYLAGRR
jgi:hypothetical protein